jgi:sugar lactone lactonase YvrE
MKHEYAVICSIAITIGSTAHAGCNGQPEGIAFDSSGNLWVSWYDSNEVQLIPTVQGTNAVTTLPYYLTKGLNGPTRIAFNGTTLYVANSTGNNVTVYDNATPNGDLPYVSPTETVTGVNRALGVAVDSKGDFFVADNQSSDVAGFAAPYTALGVQTRDSSGFQFDAPGALTIAGGYLYLGTNDGTVHSYTTSNFLASYYYTINPRFGIFPPEPPTEVATFHDGVSGGPTGVAVDAQGNVWISYYYSSDIVKYSANGTKLITITNGISQPEGIAIQPSSGNVYVSNTGTCEITVYNAGGTYMGPLSIFNSQ